MTELIIMLVDPSRSLDRAQVAAADKRLAAAEALTKGVVEA